MELALALEKLVNEKLLSLHQVNCHLWSFPRIQLLVLPAHLKPQRIYHTIVFELNLSLLLVS
jgi:hypothetical protein